MIGITHQEYLVRQATQDVRCTGHISLYVHHQLTMAGLDSSQIERTIIAQLAQEG